MTTSPSDPEKELTGVIRRPLTEMPSAPAPNRRFTRSWTSWKFTR